MTLSKTFKFNTSNFPSRHIGFDRWVDFFELLDTPEYNKSPSFPPHNIIKTSDFQYELELAVAGFKEDEFDITVEKNKMIITGEIKNKEEPEYLYRGIASRTFNKVFTLMDTILVEGASLKDGILRVHLKNSIPEAHKPKKIAITDSPPKLESSQLLIE